MTLTIIAKQYHKVPKSSTETIALQVFLTVIQSQQLHQSMKLMNLILQMKQPLKKESNAMPQNSDVVQTKQLQNLILKEQNVQDMFKMTVQLLMIQIKQYQKVKKLLMKMRVSLIVIQSQPIQ